MSRQQSEYHTFLLDTDHCHCWWCAREQEDRPPSWHAPWLIERAHIAAMPRVLDRRLVVLLCSRCHRAQHGQLFSPELTTKPPTLATMLWLKATFDPEFYDRAFVQRHHVGRIPKAEPPPASVQTVYLNRRGSYPVTE